MRFGIAVIVVSILGSCAVAHPSGSGPPGLGQSVAPSAAESTAPESTPTPLPTPVILEGEPVVWFAPLPPLPTGAGRPYTGSEDFPKLFLADAPWSHAAARIDVFKLYGEWVDRADAGSLHAAVTGIADRGIALAVEAGPLDPGPTCGDGVESFAGRESGRRLAARIKSAGGTLQVIALDEPWYFASVYDGPNACLWSVEQAAEGVAAFVGAVRETFPWVVVGDTEPNPAPVTALGLATWLDAYAAAVGEPPAFLHLDVDWSRSDWPALSVAIAGVARERGVSFGLIANGGTAPSDEAWIYRAGVRIAAFEAAAAGPPDQLLFQSWMDKPDFVLPESESTSFTALINRYFNAPGSLDDPPLGFAENVALGRPATASSAVADAPPGAAVDGDVDTIWNAGGGPSAWLEIDLGASITLDEVVLVVGQSPNGATVHVVTGLASGSNARVELGRFAGSTSDGQRLVLTVDPTLPPVRFLRIETTASPSWVAWREIEVTARP